MKLTRHRYNVNGMDCSITAKNRESAEELIHDLYEDPTMIFLGVSGSISFEEKFAKASPPVDKVASDDYADVINKIISLEVSK